MLTKVNDFTGAGNNDGGMYSSNHLGMAAFDKPAWEQMIYEQNRKYFLTSFIESHTKKGKPQTKDVINWTEDGKWYKKSQMTAIADIAAGQIRITTNESATNPYYIPTDVIDLGLAYPGLVGVNLHGRIFAVADAGGFQTIDVQILDPQGSASAVNAASFTANDEFTLKYNSQTECFTAPGSRFHSPSKYSVQMTKIAHTLNMTDEASNDTQWFKTASGSHYWADQLELRYAGLHRMAVDQAALWGQDHTFTDGSGYSGKGGEGIVSTVARRSLVSTYSGSITEDDLMEFLTALGRISDESEFHCFLGLGISKQIAVALKDYNMDGGIYYGSFGNEKNEVGVNTSSYRLNGRKVTFLEYQPFSDPDFLPQNANGTDYDNFMLTLSLKGKNRPKVVYRKNRKSGKELRGHVDYRPGITFAGNGGVAVQNQACDQTVFTTQMAIMLKGGNDNAILLKV